MKKTIRLMTILIATGLFVVGCGQSQDSDVTESSKYNFSSFTGTFFKTKDTLALIEVKHYTGERVVNLSPRQSFDPTHPKYTRPLEMKMIAELPVGTRVQIGRLMKDNGNWGGLRVTALLENGTNFSRTIYVNPRLFADNKLIGRGDSNSTNWAANPEFLQEAK